MRWCCLQHDWRLQGKMQRIAVDLAGVEVGIGLEELAVTALEGNSPNSTTQCWRCVVRSSSAPSQAIINKDRVLEIEQFFFFPNVNG